MPSLPKTLSDVRSKIGQGKKRGLNEQNTKAALIEPVLRALGWDIEDFNEVLREFRRQPRDKPVDYGLLVNRNPRLFIEAKPLNESLDNRRWANQIMGYASVAGVEWIVLTNGDEYRIYNSHASVPVEEKLFRKVVLSQDDPLAEPTLALLAKDRLEENALEVLWRAQFVDSRVKGALERLFAPESDMLLVNHVAGHTKNLTAPEIRASLARCRVTFDFPIQTAVRAGEQERGEDQRARPRARSAGRTRPGHSAMRVTVRDLISQGMTQPPADLVAKYKGQTMRAKVLSDGRIKFGGKRYPSPSMAGGAARVSATGPWPSGKLPNTNGWSFWQVKQPDGTLVTLAELRDRLPGGGTAEATG